MLDPLQVPNCPVCLRPVEVVESYGVVMWSCGYGCDDEVRALIPRVELSHVFERAFYEVVGTNKRYADSLQRRRLNRAAEQDALVPDSLTEQERGANVLRGRAIPVRAWVAFAGHSIGVEALVVEWTDRAVKVVWPGLGDEIRDAWASACERAEP